jgi:hypothetical protein
VGFWLEPCAKAANRESQGCQGYREENTGWHYHRRGEVSHRSIGAAWLLCLCGLSGSEVLLMRLYDFFRVPRLAKVLECLG